MTIMLRERREYYNAIRPSHSLNVLYAGREQCEPGHRGEGVREHFLFHYVISGTGAARVGGKRQLFAEGDGFLFAPREPLSYRASTESPWDYCWVGFAGTAAAALLFESGLLPGGVFRGAKPSLRLQELMADLVTNLRTRLPGFRMRAEGFLYFILGELVRIRAEMIGKSNAAPSGQVDRARLHGVPPYVDEAIKFIHMNYQRPVSVASVIDYIGLERSYASNLFVRSTGTSIRDYLIDYRMKRARELLAETRFSVAQVGESVGYPNYFTFERRFRNRVGMSPSDYRVRVSEPDPGFEFQRSLTPH